MPLAKQVANIGAVLNAQAVEVRAGALGPSGREIGRGAELACRLRPQVS